MDKELVQKLLDDCRRMRGNAKLQSQIGTEQEKAFFRGII